MIRIKEQVYDELVSITKEEKPDECSAILFKDNNIIVKCNPLSKSVAHFSDIDPIWIQQQIDEYGMPSALFHSHPCSAIPSSTDRMYMQFTVALWGVVWLILSDNYVLRAWTLRRENTTLRSVEEIEVKIV